MKFTDFVCRDALNADIGATEDKEDVIRNLVSAIRDAGKIPPDEYESIVEAIMDREELGTTGIGRGVAVPHTKHPSVDKIVCAVGVSKEGVYFDALDGDEVFLFFLLVSPTDRPGDHLRALENISRQLRNDTFCSFLKQSKTNDDIWQLLEESDAGKYGA